MVSNVDEHAGEFPTAAPTRINREPANRATTSAPNDGLSSVRKKYEEQGFSRGATDIIMQSWRGGTQKQYGTVFNKWNTFCNRQQISSNTATVTDVVNFLTEQYELGMSFSSLGTSRSALSILLPKVDGVNVGQHHLVTRFFRGLRNLRPPGPKYDTIWDSNLVVSYIKEWKEQGLKVATLKLTMLLALTSGQRAQTLSKLKLSDLKLSASKAVFHISEPLKTKTKGSAIVSFQAYPEKELCVVELISNYIRLTSEIRGGEDQLLLSFQKPHKAISVDTVRRYLLTVLDLAGIDTNIYKPHSTRAAATSKAKSKNVPIDLILQAGMWTNETTFSKFYDKPITENSNGGMVVFSRRQF